MKVCGCMIIFIYGHNVIIFTKTIHTQISSVVSSVFVYLTCWRWGPNNLHIAFHQYVSFCKKYFLGHTT